ncbi:hypothetical protein PR048_013303 [Dryococelus australis]|uniref:Uncharacterized protein n=1 Tax=Dryococelus australis TaxID=614101 RepID=A0ABQ9HRS3_9NEOP|nr:hypothetical protein PR048_013303 [Dryococelus australis]
MSFTCILVKQGKQSITGKIKCLKNYFVMCCTPDVSHKEQASLTIHYVYEDTDNDLELFIGYTIVENSTAEALARSLFSEIELFNVDMNDCRGQGYNNASWLKPCCCSSMKSNLCFGIQCLYTVSDQSTKCWCVIREHVKNLTMKQGSDSYQTTPEEFQRELFIPLIDMLNMSLKEHFSQFSSHNVKWTSTFANVTGHPTNYIPVTEVKVME